MSEEEILTFVRRFNRRKQGLVPVIGMELLCIRTSDSDFEGEPLNFQQFLVERFFTEDRSGLQADLYEKRRKELIEADFYYCLTLLSKLPGFQDDYADLLSVDLNLAIDDSVLLFLQQNEFPLILTTIPSDIIERSLKEKQYQSIWYEPTWDPKDLIDFSHPIVFHLLGNADSNEWVKNEKGLVFFMSSLLSVDHTPTNVLNKDRLKIERMLVMGCELPDWVFRLLLVRLFVRIDNSMLIKDASNGYWMDDSDSAGENESEGRQRAISPSQSEFLQMINFRHLSELHKVMALLNASSGSLKRGQLDNGHGYEYDIFLSYAGQDIDMKKAVLRELLRLNPELKIWSAPERTQVGGDYNERILEGIMKSRYFMPVVSDDYLDKLLSANPEHGVGLKFETQEAVKELERRNDARSKMGEPPLLTYSLPVYDPGARYYDKKADHSVKITNSILEKLSETENSQMNPELFKGKHMYEFVPNNRECSFYSRDWSECKTELR